MIAVRAYKESDEEAIRTLFALCFGRAISHDEWTWKYKASPWGSTAAVAEDGGDIVAHYGGIKSQFYCKGKTFDVYQPCDVMTHPKYRARIFSKRGAMVRAGEYFYEVNPMDFAFGFPSERHALLGTKQLGYTVHDYVTVLKKKASASVHPWRPLVRVKKGWQSVGGRGLDDLWEKIKDACGLSLVKDSRYLFWRYRDNPYKQYEPLIVESRYAKSLRAFAVLSATESGLHVLDFFAENTKILKTLLKTIEDVPLKGGSDTVTMWANTHEGSFKTLIECGFTPERGVPLIFKTMNRAIDRSFLFEQYCFRMGDYDAS
jgi:hypothetical protein